MADNPTLPLGGPTISGTRVTVDTLTKPVTVIAPTVRDLVAENEGYFAEEIFAMPGMTVEGGAILYEEVEPQYLFLKNGNGPAPRAPGAEAPLLVGERPAPKVARPESISGRIEVPDEVRRRNQVISVTNQFRQAANTFADRIQTSAITALNSFISSASRTVAGGNWRAALTNGVPNADPQDLPQADFALVQQTFQEDKAGVKPDVLLVNPADAFYLDVIYGEKLQPLLDRYGLRLRVSTEVPEGDPIFVKSRQVGVIAYEKPLDTEYEREGTRKTDVYVLEATPVIVAYDASAVLQLTGVDA